MQNSDGKLAKIDLKIQLGKYLSHIAHGGKFTLLVMILYALGNLLLYTGVELCGFHYLWVIVLVAGMLSMINFIVMKHVVIS